MTTESTSTDRKDVEDLVPSRKTNRKFTWKSLLRMPLWLLLFLVIPITIWLKINISDPWIVYSESRADFIESDFEILDFNLDPTGKPLKNKQAVDTLFQAKGVSFAYGGYVGDRMKLSSPFAELRYKGDIRKKAMAIPPPASASDTELGTEDNDSSDDDTSSRYPFGYIGISGYVIANPNGKKHTSITCFTAKTKKRLGIRRFKGVLELTFHKPSAPSETAGVQHVGFVVSRLNEPGTFEVRLFDTRGKFMGSQTNVGEQTVFMCFESNRRIGKIEVEGVGSDKDYVVGDLVFEKPW